jgi:Mor family transcriptional regulator
MSNEIAGLDERSALKQRARVLGLTYADNIPTDKLRALVGEALGEPVEVEVESDNAMRKRLQDEATKLVRVIVTNSNPNTQELAGEFFAVGNAYIPTVKRYVPFGTPNGTHVEQILLDQIQAKRYQALITKKGPNGEYKESKLVPEYGVTILPPLTKAELSELAKVQAAQGDE